MSLLWHEWINTEHIPEDFDHSNTCHRRRIMHLIDELFEPRQRHQRAHQADMTAEYHHMFAHEDALHDIDTDDPDAYPQTDHETQYAY